MPFSHELLVQGPDNPDAIVGGLERIAATVQFTRVRGAYAFANGAGALQLTDTLGAATDNWSVADKRWLISFDFGFTEPTALELLDGLPASEVRVPNAEDLLSR